MIDDETFKMQISINCLNQPNMMKLSFGLKNYKC